VSQETTVIDMGDGLYLYRATTTYKDGTVTNGRSVKIGVPYVTQDSKGIGSSHISSNYTGDGASAKALNKYGEHPKDYSDKYIKSLKDKGYN